MEIESSMHSLSAKQIARERPFTAEFLYSLLPAPHTSELEDGTFKHTFVVIDDPCPGSQPTILMARETEILMARETDCVPIPMREGWEDRILRVIPNTSEQEGGTFEDYEARIRAHLTQIYQETTIRAWDLSSEVGNPWCATFSSLPKTQEAAFGANNRAERRRLQRDQPQTRLRKWKRPHF